MNKYCKLLKFQWNVNQIKTKAIYIYIVNNFFIFIFKLLLYYVEIFIINTW